MADWDGLRDEVERAVTPPPFAALRERRRRRQQRRAIAATFAVVMVGTASGVAILGQHPASRGGGGPVVAAGTVSDRVALGDRIATKADYPYVVTDVDFVSADTGWAIGLRCTGDACDVATWRTDDGGRSWGPERAVARHVARSSFAEQDPHGGGARSLRMLDARYGYAFNPDLYVTRDGGGTWTRARQPSKVALVSAIGGSAWVLERGCSADDDCDATLRTGRIGATSFTKRVMPKTAGAQAILRRTDESHAFLVTWDAPSDPRGAAYRTADAGATWQRATNPCPDASGIALSARPDRPLLLVCSGAFDEVAHSSAKQAYVSTDAATSWRRLADPPAAGALTDLVSASATRSYLTTKQPARLLVTDDGGATWAAARGATQRAYGFANLDSPDATHTWAMGDAGVLWRTADGTTWERLALPPGAPRATGTPRALAPADAGVVFTGLSFLDADRGFAVGRRCVAHTCRAVLRRTDDGGRTWQPANAPTQTWRDDDGSPGNEVGAVTFADARNGWLYGSALLATHDGGATWKAVGAANDVVARDGYVWIVGYEGCAGTPCGPHVERAKAGSDRFAGTSLDLPIRVRASFDAVDATHAYVVDDGTGGDQDPKVLATSDGGRTWVAHPAPCRGADTRALSAWAVDRLWVVCEAAGKRAVARSSDGGATWHTVMSAETGGAVRAVRALSATYGWRAESGPTPLRVTRDGGRTWAAGLTGPRDLADLVFATPTNGWALALDGTVYRTTDGATWEPAGRP